MDEGSSQGKDEQKRIPAMTAGERRLQRKKDRKKKSVIIRDAFRKDKQQQAMEEQKRNEELAAEKEKERRDRLKYLGTKKVSVNGKRFMAREICLRLIKDFCDRNLKRTSKALNAKCPQDPIWKGPALLKPLAGLPSLEEMFAAYLKKDDPSADIEMTPAAEPAAEPSADDKQESWGITYDFVVESADHAETPFQAYQDIVTILYNRAAELGKEASELRIYDPYFCTGNVKRHLMELGFPNVHNENTDFYKAIKNGTVPEFDILVTNPPYSGDHVNRLITFCEKLDKPSLLLLPKYFYMKPYFTHLADGLTFICPDSRYVYEPPADSCDHSGEQRRKKAKKTSPFASMWYLMNEASNQGGIRWWDLPNEYKDELDPYRQAGIRKTKLSDGRKLCKECGQVVGNCRHTK